MLQYRTVQPRTLEILGQLMLLPQLSDFYLVGGTALSLQFGHRTSVDLDLFSVVEFDPPILAQIVGQTFSGFTYGNVHNAVGLFSFIDDVKVDFVRYHYHPMISEPVVVDGIRMFGLPDIAAMKISAILKRAVKKDFWDIAEILKHYTVAELIEFYNKKYPSQQLLISIPTALTWFSDAEDSEEPVSLNGQNWKRIKHEIQKKVNLFLK